MIEHTWKQNLLAAPGIGLSLLPKIACPACWPAYAGLLSSLGLGFLISNAKYLLSMTAAFLVLAVGLLAFRARRRHGYVPFALRILAASLILFGKFSLVSNPVLYAELGLLILASVWNSWPIASRCICAPAAEKFPPIRGAQGEMK
jgi:mercuric ion transport protein